MKLKYYLAASVAGLTTGIFTPFAAFAQSTGAAEFEDDAIIVTGARIGSVGGVDLPATPKAKQVLDQEAIRHQRPGQTVNDIINLVPGVSFQNNDPWGSGGGGFTIRGFGADRVSQTVDGIPLNDSGNYALYTNQQVDPEVLESVSVNLGVTDVDSPTASATGGTVNIRTRIPSEDFGITATASYGNVIANGSTWDRPYYRVFGMVDTGSLTASGTRAFFSASYTEYENPFNNYGENKKQQYNGRIYQPIGDNGDFVSISGHYNENRNNFFGSQELDPSDPLNDGFPDTREERFYDINFPCTIPAGQLAGGGGVNGTAEQYSDSTGCGAEFDRRYNPSNTGNVRGSSRFTLADGLLLTVDPSYQYVKANGGGAEDLREAFFTVDGVPYTGFLSGGYYYGMDLNGDGDLLDRVAGIDPSQTRTHRYGVIASLAYEINPDHRVRIAYTWDRADHRQTGQTTYMDSTGEPLDVFPVNDPISTSDGFALNKRDRQSYAILHQVSGEYRGNFGPVRAVVGLRAPFFTRDLNQFCYTTSASGFVDCIGDQDPAAYEAANPDNIPPIAVTYKYEKLLPNVGFTVDIGESASAFANYAKGLSVPGTDPLYDSLYLINEPGFGAPEPETTDSFDLGVRFRTGTIRAQAAAWYTRYQNRLASAYDPVLDETIFRNLGQVDKWGFDASVAWSPTPESLLYVFGSINQSEIQEDVETDTGFLPTAGSRESGTPSFSIGARGQIRFGNFELGAQIKHTGERWLNDINSAQIDSYTLVDLDLRYTFGEGPLGGDMAVQLNITNLFDELYVGYFGGTLDDTSPFVQIGAPRAASISLIMGY